MLVLPDHRPVGLAERVATVDALSGGRVRLCVGMGWLKEEIEACGGTEFASPGRRADEQIEVMRLLWEDRPDGASYYGEFFEFDHAACYPKPARRVPIHIGAAHRAPPAGQAGYVDGFQPLGVGGSELTELIAIMRDEAGKAGRDPDALELSLGHLVAKVDGERADKARGDGRRPGRAGYAAGRRHREACEMLSTCAQRLALTP